MEKHFGFYYKEDDLVHHGIVGQKWGRRRYQNPDGSLTPEGRIRYGYANHHEIAKAQGLRDKDTVKTIKQIQRWDNMAQKETVGSQIKKTFSKHKRDNKAYFDSDMYVSGSLKGAYGVAKANYKYNKAMKLRQNEKIDNKTGLFIKKKPLTADEDTKLVNPSHSDITASSSNNCCLCSIAYDVRRRGYDVMAKQHAKIDLVYDVGEDDIKNWYPGAKQITPSKSKNSNVIVNQTINGLLKEPDGTRGCLLTSWSDCSGGHVVAYEKENGKLIVRDSQCGEAYKNVKTYKDLPKVWEYVDGMSYMRLDHLTPDWNKIKEAIE